MSKLFYMVVLLLSFACHKETNQNTIPKFESITLVINPNGKTPLAGKITFQCNQSVQVKCIIKGKDGIDLVLTTLSQNSINVVGLYPDTDNEVHLVVTGITGTYTDTMLIIHTTKLPLTLPAQENIHVNKVTNESSTDFVLFYPYKVTGSAFNSLTKGGYPFIIDKFGKIRGFIDIPNVLDMKPLANGHYLYCDSTVISEIDLLGNVYSQFNASCHHDFLILPNGNILFTGEDKSINGTVEDKIYEVDYNTGTIISTINLYDLLDHNRKQLPVASSMDWFHNNSITYDNIDNSIVISGRSQSTICKIDMKTRSVKWILSDPTNWSQGYNLLQPIGVFEYSYGQHSVQISPYNHNRILAFDNGNSRSYTNPLPASQSYSRLVEYSIDPEINAVHQLFEYGKAFGSENFSPATGSVDYITADKFFICFPLILKNSQGVADANGLPQVRFVEVDRLNNVSLDITIKETNTSKGIRTYRGHPFKFS